MVFACRPASAFSPVVLVRFDDFSPVTHDSLIFFVADELPETF